MILFIIVPFNLISTLIHKIPTLVMIKGSSAK